MSAGKLSADADLPPAAARGGLSRDCAASAVVYLGRLMPTPRANLEDVSARVQQFLLNQGAHYVSRATEENWKHAAVALNLPEHTHLPAGVWVVLPWDAPTPDELEAWLTLSGQSTLPPRVVVMAMDVPSIRGATMQTLASAHGVDVVGISALDRHCYGSPIAPLLQPIFAPEADAVMAATNPLEHLAVGDPRNPEVFFERLRRASPTTAATPWIIRANIAMFMVSVALSLRHPGASLMDSVLIGFDEQTLRTLGANSMHATVVKGEAWRLLSCAFLHANLLHIGMNLYILKAMGDLAERLFGSLAYLSLYLVSAIGGSLLSLAWTLRITPTISVGASGAVFGVMGGMLGFALSRRKSVPMDVYRGLLRSAAMFTVINLAFGFMLKIVDNGAHIGGLLAGLVAGLVLSRDLPPAPQPGRVQILATFVALLGALGLAYAGLIAAFAA
jgi:membrane associated rhomboid family serine protease